MVGTNHTAEIAISPNSKFLYQSNRRLRKDDVRGPDTIGVFAIAPDKGTGLGLAIVKGLVTALGGKVSLESRLNQGTRVIVLLPPERQRRATKRASGLVREGLVREHDRRRDRHSGEGGDARTGKQRSTARAAAAPGSGRW